MKANRPEHRVVPASRFEQLADIAHLADKLFGRLPADPLPFLRSRLRPDTALTPAWIGQVGSGNFAAIPRDVGWNDAAPLAHLVDGYRLLELLDDSEPAAFLDYQSEVQRGTGSWPGDAALLWTTLFLEARADHFGANHLAIAFPHLDLLCRQLPKR